MTAQNLETVVSEDLSFEERLRRKIDLKTKPLGALGRLEELAFRIACVQGTLEPELRAPTLFVFAADHGLATSGVSAYPKEVTAQMVANFLAGGAAINVFCRQHGLRLRIVDAGVDADLEPHPDLIDAKVARGTRSLLEGPAMDPEQLREALGHGRAIVREHSPEGCNVVGFGEMGIGNTASSSLIMAELTGLPMEQCVGRGTGLTEEGLAHKLEILRRVRDLHGAMDGDPERTLRAFGGFEIAQLCGAMLEARRLERLFLVDGFIASAAYLLAATMDPKIESHAIFCHLSGEQGHARLLEAIGVQPLLNLGLRLGEGTGCAIAYPILQSAVCFLREMASFESAGVSQKE